MTPAKWDFVTLKTYIDTKFGDADKRYEQRFSDSGTAVNAALMAAEKAVAKAETAADKRFESVNEFRETLSDQQRTFIPRTEAEMRMAALESRLATLDSRITERRGQVIGADRMWGYIVGGIGVLVGIGGLFLALLHSK
jgi:uncharacterized protein YceH (UPF0502 family)